jgi:hypothetical protein
MSAFYLNIHVSITKFIFVLNIWRRKSGSGPMANNCKRGKGSSWAVVPAEEQEELNILANIC